MARDVVVAENARVFGSMSKTGMDRPIIGISIVPAL
jgi:hypothetical protein